jgi:dephospho-CoA kinase
MSRSLNANHSAPYIIGLTGGVGSGKSTAMKRFVEVGAFAIDVDDVSRAITAKGGRAVAAVAAAFPQAMNNDEIDRARLREIVFADSEQRKHLEAILHPIIREETQRSLASDAAVNAPYSLLVVPLLFESSAYASIIECAIVVDVPVEMQIERVVTTRGVERMVAEGIVAAQMSREERLRRAQFVIDNSGSRDALNAQVVRLHEVFIATANHRRGIALNESHTEAVV